MKHENILNYLQSLHPTTKLRILVLVGIVSAVTFTSFWLNNIDKQFESEEVVQTGSVLSASNHVAVESTGVKEGKRYIYFSIKNDTSDILNFSQLEDVKLIVDGNEYKPEALTDRQQATFVRKVLSNSTIFGTLVFNDFKGNDGFLTFDGLYFETASETIFKETIEIDFDTLKTVEELRS